MREITTEIEIYASPNRVWATLTDFASFPFWNPFIKRINGNVKPGNWINVEIQQPGQQAIGIKVKVLQVDQGQELRWVSKWWIPGLFDSEHYFIIEPIEENRVRFVHGQRFIGIGTPVLQLLWLFSGLQEEVRGLDEMNQALKARVEGVTI